MTTSQQQLLKVLAELFQLDQADLDFGIYRIMNQKREEINQFLEKDLLPQVQEIIAGASAVDTEGLRKELAEAEAGAKALGVDPAVTPKYQEIKSQLDAAPDLAKLEAEVFAHLAHFFRRYYDKGDFISQRRYKKDVYAIPYEGEEVKLHWANHDQYYIKSSEYLKNFAFKVPTGRVRFELVDASTEQDNNKAAAGKNRYFQLYEAQPVTEDGNELVINFTYQSLNKAKQKDLNEAAAATLATALPKRWQADLLALKPTAKQKDRTLLLKHLNDFTARNTFDYFIHKDLGGFLNRELDFYIKNEVVNLDDIDHADPEGFRVLLTRVKALKEIARKIIRFLAQLEEFQKRLWLKKKFVLATHYCLTLDKIPDTYHPEIVANDAQWQEWKDLFVLSSIPKDLLSGDGSRESILKNQPHLVLDTKFFDTDFKYRLLGEFDDLDEQTDGLLINSENFQALRLLEEQYQERVDCVYIDPPYNTAASEIVYKNGYKTSTWMTLLSSRLGLGERILQNEGLMCVTIDDFQQKELHSLLEKAFPVNGYVGTVVIRNNPSGRPTPTGFAVGHEYGIFYRKSENAVISRVARTKDQLQRFNQIDENGAFEFRNLRREGSNSDRKARQRLYYPIVIDQSSLTFSVPEMVWLEGSNEWKTDYKLKRNEVFIFPIDDNGNEKTWRWKNEKVSKSISTVQVRKRSDGKLGIYIKNRPSEDGAVPPTLWTDAKYSATEHGTKVLKDLGFSTTEFSYPKSIYAVEDSLKMMGASNSDTRTFTLDYFAGSGTTAHAVINLNREDEGQRKYILVEMGNYFDTVTKPRVQKVIYSEDWKDGKPVSRKGSSHLFKYLHLESYEDTLNNLTATAPDEATSSLLENDSFREDYMLGYSLDVSTKDSLLTVADFATPFDYQLTVTEDDEAKPTSVDLVETFNYLIGLRVKTIKAIDGFRVVTGVRPDDKTALVIWRTIGDDAEAADEALHDFFEKEGYAGQYDVVYVNGDNSLASLRSDGDRWQVLLTEREFLQRMFTND